MPLGRGEDVIQVDARPSDSIAIALRLSAPIFAQESLLTAIAVEEAEEAEDEGPEFGTPEPETSAGGEQMEMTGEELKEHLKRMRPEDFGKFNP